LGPGASLTPAQGGEAQRLVACAYGARDLFGAEGDLVEWARALRADRPAESLLPAQFAPATAGALMSQLRDAGVVTQSGAVDEYRLWQFQQVIALLPYVHAEEQARVPPAKPKVVFTVPPGVTLPDSAAHLQRSLAERIFDVLTSATTRTLLASPFWSDKGAEHLWAPLQTSVDLRLPITLAGARADADRDDLGAMLRLAAQLRDAGAQVTALQFAAPKSGSLFHAKLVCGRVGYLGSANLTAAGLGEHVEAGAPLDEADVERTWWLLDVLVQAGLLVETTP
jgi:hypothetical protein